MFGIFAEGNPTAIATMDMVGALTLPSGHYKLTTFADILVAAGSILTVRQTAGQTVEFSAAGVWFQ